MNVFDYIDYKKFLKDIVTQQPKGFITKLSMAAGCQRSYLSDVLNRHIHLTPDQADGIGEFLGLSRAEEDYFQLLLQSERASSKRYREKIRLRCADLKSNFQRLNERLSNHKASESQFWPEYYSAWYIAAIHIGTSIIELGTSQKIADYLKLPEPLVKDTLKILLSNGLVTRDNGFWRYEGANTNHLQDNSHLNRMNHLNWRVFAMNRPFDHHKDIHYSSVFAVGSDDIIKLREQVLNLIAKQRKNIQISGSDELVAFCCDWFSLG